MITIKFVTINSAYHWDINFAIINLFSDTEKKSI